MPTMPLKHLARSQTTCISRMTTIDGFKIGGRRICSQAQPLLLQIQTVKTWQRSWTNRFARNLPM